MKTNQHIGTGFYKDGEQLSEETLDHLIERYEDCSDHMNQYIALRDHAIKWGDPIYKINRYKTLAKRWADRRAIVVKYAADWGVDEETLGYWE